MPPKGLKLYLLILKLL